jgi:hypothetical protein
MIILQIEWRIGHYLICKCQWLWDGHKIQQRKGEYIVKWNKWSLVGSVGSCFLLLKIEYLALLLENDLLEYIEGERAFKTTPKEYKIETSKLLPLKSSTRDRIIQQWIGLQDILFQFISVFSYSERWSCYYVLD